MPRTADHERRRMQVTNAVRAVLARDGFDAVTVAAIAREAVVSVGLVQHYFPSKEALLVDTYRATLESVDARVDAQVAAAEAAREPIRVLLPPALALYLPLDSGRRTDHAVRLALLVRSATGPLARRLAAEHHAALRSRLAGVVRNGKSCGEVVEKVDEARAGDELVSLVTGLADQLFVADRGRRALGAGALGLLDDAVGRIFTEPCSYEAR